MKEFMKAQKSKSPQKPFLNAEGPSRGCYESPHSSRKLVLVNSAARVPASMRCIFVCVVCECATAKRVRTPTRKFPNVFENAEGTGDGKGKMANTTARDTCKEEG